MERKSLFQRVYTDGAHSSVNTHIKIEQRLVFSFHFSVHTDAYGDIEVPQFVTNKQICMKFSS